MASNPEAAARVVEKRKQGQNLLELFFICWEEQTANGRHCTGENPQQSAAFEDFRFSMLDAHWALLHQCQVGLFNLDGKGKRHKKPTYFVSSSTNIMHIDLHCDHSHDHNPLKGSFQGRPVTK
jgi:hypothetical protein